ncbi:MAG: tRNA dihydrouridine synthase [Promethearchaeota archaeon]
MKLGSLNLKNNLILAPLQNVTSSPYRNFCRHFSDIGLVCVPMLYTKRLMKNPKSIEQDLYNLEKERPISVQLIGNDVNALKSAINYLESYEFDVLDINAGCPSKRAINANEGGALLRDLESLNNLLSVAVQYSSKPVSLKTRLGFDKVDVNFLEKLAKLLNTSGIDFATIHARLIKYRLNASELNLELLKNLKELAQIPIVGNGDIVDPYTAKRMIDYTKVDALMIGRGSMGYPEIFFHIYDYLSNAIEVSHQNNISLMKSYTKLYEKYIDEFLEDIKLNYSHKEFKFVELKRNAIWLTKDIKDSTSIRRDLSNAKNLKQLKNILQKIDE